MERFICKPVFGKNECYKLPVYHTPQQKMFINQFAAYYEMFNITGPEESLTKVFFRIPKQFHIVFSKEYFYRFQEIKSIAGFIDLAEYKQYLNLPSDWMASTPPNRLRPCWPTRIPTNMKPSILGIRIFRQIIGTNRMVARTRAIMERGPVIICYTRIRNRFDYKNDMLLITRFFVLASRLCASFAPRRGVMGDR